MQQENSSKSSQGPIDYGDFGYWDERYTKKKGQRFEWLQPYSRLKPYIYQCLPKGKDSLILNIGCGNSCIQEDMYEDGYHHIANNDISAVVIQQMSQSMKDKGYEGMSYAVMDVRKMTYEDQAFDFVLDKSTIDTLMCSENPLMNVAQMIQSIHRVLKTNGFYLTVSYSGDRMTHFKREHVHFSIQHKQLKRINEEGHQIINHLYICQKLATAKMSSEQREDFYRKLKEQEEKEYPPL